MNLTPLQLEIQQRADKTLSFGCIVVRGVDITGILIDDVGGGHFTIKFDKSTSSVRRNSSMDKIIGHPMNWGRLCYLAPDIGNKEREKMFNAFTKENLQQTVLERPVELQELVLAFLKTLGT